MNPFSRHSSVSSSTSARPSNTSRPNSPAPSKMSSSSSLPKQAKHQASSSTSTQQSKPKPKLASVGGTKMKHQTISVSDLFGNNSKRSSASPRPSVITTTTTGGSSFNAIASTSYSNSNSNNSNFSSAMSNASSTSSHAPLPQPSLPSKLVRDFSPALSATSATTTTTTPTTSVPTIPRIRLRLKPTSATTTPQTTPPLPTPPPVASSSTSVPVASTSALPKTTTTTTNKKKRLPELPTFVSAADTLLTAGTSSRPNVHRVFSPSVPPSPTGPPASAIKKAKAAMKGKGKASPIPQPLVGPVIASTSKGKGKGKGRAKEEVVEPTRPASPTKPSSVPYPSNEASTSQLPDTSKPTTPDKSKALKTRRPSIPSVAQKMPIGLFPGDGDSDGSLTSLPSEFQSSDSLTSDDGKGDDDDKVDDDDDVLTSDGEPDILFISSSKRRPSQALSSSEDNSEMDSDSDSGTFSSTTNGLDEDMDDDEDEMLMEEEDFVRRDERSRRGGGNGGGRGRKGGWENVRDREDGFEVSSWGGGTDGYSHDEDLDDDDEEDEDDDDETDAFGLGGRGGGGGVKVLTFDAAGARTGSWSEDSSDEDEEQELWFDGLSDFDLEEDVLVGADGIGGIIPVEGEEMYIETFDDLNALSSQSLSRPVDLGGTSSSSSRRTSGERKAALDLDMDYELELDLEGDLAMAELLSGGVGDGEPGSMLIMEDWDGQLVFGPGSVDGSGGAFEFATESEGDCDGQKDADRMEDLWGEEEFLDESYEGDEEGDTTDSLPDDEDDEMMLPPDVYPLPSANSSNAPSTVTADSPAAIFGLPSPMDGVVPSFDIPTPPTISIEPASPHPKTALPPPASQARPQLSSFPSSIKVVSSHPTSPLARPSPHRVASLGGRSSHSKGPIMGSFVPLETANPLRTVIIDGRKKSSETPSPFARRSNVRGRGRGGAKAVEGSARKRKGESTYPFAPAPTKRARYGAVPGPTHFSSRRPSFREDTPSSPDLPPTEAVSLEDVLDSSLLYHGNSDGSGGGGERDSRSIQSLSRWDRIPIGTFRGRARGQASTHLIGSRARPAPTYNADGPSSAKDSIFRNEQQLVQQAGPRMLTSPLMFAMQGSESPSFGPGSGGELSRKAKRHEKKRAKRESGGGGSLKVPDFSLDA